jgi:hypothetical protein
MDARLREHDSKRLTAGVALANGTCKQLKRLRFNKKFCNIFSTT